MKIGLDFDGVVADCGRLKSETALKLFGVKIPPEDFNKEAILSAGLLSADQYTAMQKLIYETREFGLRAMPVAEVFIYVQRLLKEHHVHIVTSRGDAGTAIAREWLASQRKGVDIDFTGVGPGNSKAEALQGFDVYVDDDLDKIAQVVDSVPHRFLFSWEYNRHIAVGDVAERVGSWSELYHRINEIPV